MSMCVLNSGRKDQMKGSKDPDPDPLKKDLDPDLDPSSRSGSESFQNGSGSKFGSI